MNIGRLHIITDICIQDRFSHLELAKLGIEGGADTIQLRDKTLSTRELYDSAVAMGEVCRRKRIPLIINDRLDVAIASDSSGVHLGADDLPLAAARRLLGPDRQLGSSCDSGEEARDRFGQGADYAGIGPIFPTSSKSDTGPVLGLDRLAEAVRRSPLPLIAIGGLTVDNLPEVLATGVYGVAFLSTVCCAKDPTAVVASIRSQIEGRG